jgi:hypothetical protein
VFAGQCYRCPVETSPKHVRSCETDNSVNAFASASELVKVGGPAMNPGGVTAAVDVCSVSCIGAPAMAAL